MPKVQSSNICDISFCLKIDDQKTVEIIDALPQFAKKWVFQEELSDDGHHHYQGRLSLHKKCRIGAATTLLRSCPLFEKMMCIPTIKEEAKTCMFKSYNTKIQTRVAGPWTSKDPPPYEIFKQHQIESYYPWQQQIVDSCQTFEKRIINCLIDPGGKLGKSTLIANACSDRKIFDIFPMHEQKDLMRAIMNTLGEEKYPKAIFIDLPRANSKKLDGLFTACECVKEGKVYDDRYTFKVHKFQTPVVWVMMNWEPKTHYMSKDRWRFWKVVDQQLIPYKSKNSSNSSN